MGSSEGGLDEGSEGDVHKVNTRAITYALPLAVAATVAAGGMSIMISLAVLAVPGAPAALWNTAGFVPSAFLGILFFPYTLIVLPITFSVSFYRVALSDDSWGALKERWRSFTTLVAVGSILCSLIWVSGVYIA